MLLLLAVGAARLHVFGFGVGPFSCWLAMDTFFGSSNTDIFFNVITRLQTKCLLKVKCVCKGWYHLLSNRVFIKCQLQQQEPIFGFFFQQRFKWSSDDRDIINHIPVDSKAGLQWRIFSFLLENIPSILYKNKSTLIGGILHWSTDGDEILTFNVENELSWLISVPISTATLSSVCRVRVTKILGDELSPWMDPLAFKDGYLLMMVCTSIYLYNVDTNEMKRVCRVNELSSGSYFNPIVLPYSLSLAPLSWGTVVGSNYWIAWATDEKHKVSREQLPGVFVFLLGGSSIFILGRAVLLATMAMKTAQCFFQDMITSVFKAPFHSLTPHLQARSSIGFHTLISTVKITFASDFKHLVLTELLLRKIAGRNMCFLAMIAFTFKKDYGKEDKSISVASFSEKSSRFKGWSYMVIQLDILHSTGHYQVHSSKDYGKEYKSSSVGSFSEKSSRFNGCRGVQWQVISILFD
ncbi:hypothetical protein Pint_16533 [Pistacia integerrima]|uniref:Uncharacterized protein n=1 Tax=Pistacia integerrima TaxID=434235 RepID=A0ACC0ZE73_9ROSI|nr:hypothetical protein Pint_16533 [Pistacia integerrima]